MSDKWFSVRKAPVEVEARGPITEPDQIETPEGTMDADEGDYIIRGVEGEIYPVKPDIFTKTYQRIGDNMDVALNEREQSTIIDQLVAGLPEDNPQKFDGANQHIQSDAIEAVLDKFSPNWRNVNSKEDIKIRSITVHRNGIQRE